MDALELRALLMEAKDMALDEGDFDEDQLNFFCDIIERLHVDQY